MTPLLPAEPIKQRGFLKRVSGIAAGIMAALVGAPVATAFLSPVLKKPTTKAWLKVVDDVATIDVGKPVKIDFVEAVNDAWVANRALRSVWVYSDDGAKLTAFSNVCTHLGCSYVYQKSCKQCHGALGAPTKAAIKLDSKTPDFTNAAFFVDKKDEDLRAAVAKGKGKKMEGFADKLSKEDISAVVEYIHTLHKK